MEQKIDCPLYMERTFVMRCESNDAANWGIRYGDRIVWDLLDTNEPESGQMIVVRFGGKYALRKYYKHKGVISLVSPSGLVSPLAFTKQEGDNFGIAGIVEILIKKEAVIQLV